MCIRDRVKRLQILRNCARYAQTLGTDRIAIHFGFIPECASDPSYESVVETAQQAADICAEHGCTLLLEVGEETPTTLLRLLEDAKRENLAVEDVYKRQAQHGRAGTFYAQHDRGP